MFQEAFATHPLSEMLAVPTVPLFPPAGDAAWDALQSADRQEVLALADAYRSQPYPMRLATGFLAFVRDGSRKADEDAYFFRRRKLCAAALGYCAAPNQTDLDAVVDGLWCICEETSWVISAHNVNPIPGAPSCHEVPLPQADAPYIDLFSAQTGMILSLVCSLLAAPLDGVTPLLRQRVQGEIDRRILTPFMATDDFWWMGVRRTDLNNWTPWIVSNVMMAAILRPHDQLASLLERACVMLDRWLACVPEDGGCDEGAAYWNLAGGALLDCLQLLEHATAGQATFWQEEKLRRVLAFPAVAHVDGGWFVNFADCDARPWLSGERLQYAGEKLGDSRLVALGGAMRGTLADELNDTPHLSRVLYKLFHPSTRADADAPTPADAWLPHLQLRVVRRGSLVLCAKGGHNGESHNHNDVGSFMLYAGGEPCLVDAGNMVYTAKTFSDQRYTLWNTRSAYHSLPIIGTHEQQPGTSFAAKDVCCTPNGLVLDMAPAYPPQAQAFLCRRSFALREDALQLADELRLGAPQPVTWVFLARQQPTPVDGGAVLGSVRMDFDPSLRLAVEEIPVTDARMARSYPGSLWRMTLTAAPADIHRQVFRFALG